MGLADVFEMNGQAVDELERGELALYRQHAVSGWFSTCPLVKYLDGRAAGALRRPLDAFRDNRAHSAQHMLLCRRAVPIRQ
jgi:hypothetical protein